MADHQVIFQLTQKSIEQEESEPLNHVLNHLPESMMEAAEAVLTQTENLDPLGKDILENLVHTLVELRERDVSQRLDYLRFEQENRQVAENCINRFILMPRRFGTVLVHLLKTPYIATIFNDVISIILRFHFCRLLNHVPRDLRICVNVFPGGPADDHVNELRCNTLPGPFHFNHFALDDCAL